MHPHFYTIHTLYAKMHNIQLYFKKSGILVLYRFYREYPEAKLTVKSSVIEFVKNVKLLSTVTARFCYYRVLNEDIKSTYIRTEQVQFNLLPDQPLHVDLLL